MIEIHKLSGLKYKVHLIQKDVIVKNQDARKNIVNAFKEVTLAVVNVSARVVKIHQVK